MVINDDDIDDDNNSKIEISKLNMEGKNRRVIQKRVN